MEEIEVPTEQVQEEIHHLAHEARERWVMGVALSSALLAALAAVSALMAGHHSNEAMIDQLEASDQWAYYQAKGIKSAVLGTKIDVLKGLGKEPAEKDLAKIEDYKKEQEKIKETAEGKEHSSKHHLNVHVILARSVTFFQIAITLGAVAALTKRRRFWYVSLALGVFGIYCLIQGLALG